LNFIVFLRICRQSFFNQSIKSIIIERNAVNLHNFCSFEIKKEHLHSN